MSSLSSPVYRWLSLTISLLLYYNLGAQYDPAQFTHYTVSDGLSDDFVESIVQDSKGYIWIATDNGLNRFDGDHFENFFQNQPKGFLHSSKIRKIKKLASDRLAIVTTNRTEILDENDYHSFSLFIPDTTLFSSVINDGWDVLEVPGQGYAVTTAVGFDFFNLQGALLFRYDAFTAKDVAMKRMLFGRNMLLLPDNQILVYVESNQQAIFDIPSLTFQLITPDSFAYKPLCHPDPDIPLITKARFSAHGFIVVPQNDSIIYYDIDQRKHIASPLPIDWKTELNWSSTIVPLSDSTFVITGRVTGFYVFTLDKKTGIIHGGDEKFFAAKEVNDVILDRDHRLWIATMGGVYKQNLEEPFIHTFSKPVLSGPLSDSTHAFGVYFSLLKYMNWMYAGRFDVENGLVVMDPQTFEIKKTITLPNRELNYNIVTCIQVYYEDTLWLGSENGMIWYDTRTDHHGKVSDLLHNNWFNYFSALLPVRSDGDAWMAGYLNGVVGKYNVRNRTLQIFTRTTTPPIPFEKIKHLAYDAEGNVWISGHSLARWNQSSSSFDTVINTYAGPNKFKDDILLMQADDLGNLWLVNDQNGLLQYKTRSHEWHYFGIEDGFPNAVFQSMSPVINHQIWLSDPYHLSRFDIDEEKIYTYGETEGLPSAHVQSRYMYYDDSSSKMYLLLNNEIATWNINDFPKRTAPVDLICESIRMKDTQTFFFPKEKLIFAHDQNDLNITYSVIDYQFGPRYQFAYRLHPKDPWIQLGDQRKLFLSNLSPGQYDVEFKARSLRGAESIHHLSLIIRPPFWQTAWFWAIVMVSFFALIVFVYRKKIEAIRIKANIDRLLSESEMKALHAQMNPHFIFNSLNSIRNLVLRNDNYNASRYLGKFAHLIRMTLNQSRQSYTSLRLTIEYLERYIELEKIRNPKFSCCIEADENLDLDEIHLPPMLIQPLIENAIWHGAMPEQEEIDILVRFERQGDQLVCVIDDNGIGIEASLLSKTEATRSHQGVGIENIQSRIELLNKKHNRKSSLTLEDKAKWNGGHESGTRVTLRLPIELNEDE